MNQYCFICNSRAGISLRNAVNIFGENNLQQSGKSMVNILSEILDKEIKEKNIHSKILCNKCHKTCIEYDSIQIRLQVIKSLMLTQFKKTLPRHNLDYDTYNEESSPTKFSGKKIVLPASKLQPLPSNFVLKGGKLGTTPLSNFTSKLNNPEIRILSPSTLNLKVTVGSSVLTQSIKTTGVTNKQRGLAHTVTSSVTSTLTSVTSSVTSTSFTNTKTTSPVLSFTLEEPPKDIFSGELNQSSSPKSDENDDDPVNDDQPMEIDEACSLAVITTTANEGKLIFEDIDKNDEEKSKSFFDVDLLSSLSSPAGEGEGEGKYVVGKLQMMQGDDDDDDQPTIVMGGENGSIIRVMSGQKFLCGTGEISLVMPEEADLEGQDTQDSNEESQFELHVSGDEETANAIIAAAQEQGGAFIKVESGEMFRVESVQSKTDDDVSDEDDAMLLDIVARENGQFKCLICERNDSEGAQFVGSAANMAQHMRSAHGARIHICALCGLILRKKADYLAHLSKHKNLVHTDKSKIHECNVCQKKYNSKSTLAEHMHTHTGSKPHTCSVCIKSFASKYTLQSHLKTHLDRPRPFKCTQCGKSFLTQQNLNQHEKTHSGVKEFICKVCGKAFGALHNLEVHGVVHSGNKPFVCGVCSKGFARRAEVRDHMRIHTGERPFSCEECGARFTQRSNLHSHRRATHLDDKRHVCHLCPKRFKRRRLLDYHVKASHTGERPLQCEVCQASFVYPEHFKKHMRIHSGEKPYSCEVCGRQFNTRDNLNTHRYVHSDKKPYECVVCSAGYMRKQQLYHHMKNTGHLAESIVVNQPRILKVPQNVVTSAGTIIIDPGKEEDTADIRSSGIFEETQEENVKPIENSTLDIIQNNEVQPLITLHNISTEKDNSILETISEEQLTEDNAQITTVDATNANVTRLIQFQLPDGTSGWLAV
ncbi:uncharacterized protein LOC106711047 [Papilio machaon]|uniref:uncharacterized protein LOC106711047 n=1 Tax=Papilio machaon TaxID=76193 RepID=UPI001E66604D|nr:uncharacterized protein LOC106711047 [Papilio machaon]